MLNEARKETPLFRGTGHGNEGGRLHIIYSGIDFSSNFDFRPHFSVDFEAPEKLSVCSYYD